MNDPVRAYHEASKHRLDRYAPGPGYLDWETQPYPWRLYEGTARLPLALAADALTVRYNALRRGELPPPAPLDLAHIGLLLELSLGLSAWKQYGGNRWALRCNPSSGNLHPTEAYVLAPRLPGIAPGVYHYLSRDHALEARATAADGWSEAIGGEHLLLALTSIHWREAWKYGLRAWRYCQHDCGHAIAAVTYAAAALGWRVHRVATASDDDLARLTGLDRPELASVESEVPDVLLAIGPTAGGLALERLLQQVGGCAWHGRPNRLSPQTVPWDAIDQVQAATRRPRASGVAGEQQASPSPPPSSDPALDLPAAVLYRQRRSAVAFDGVTRMSAQAFFTALDALLPRAGVPPWHAWPHPSAVHLALFVHRVDGLAPGLYVLARDPAAVPQLKQGLRSEWRWDKVGPEALPLYLLLPSDTRTSARIICCHQEIAADSCFALGMLADFSPLQGAPWRYRDLYWECGMIGQALYLEAEAAGLRATGIGCFFDDAMHQLLGVQNDRWQSLYHFTVGGPVEDTRLSTMPPYAACPGDD